MVHSEIESTEAEDGLVERERSFGVRLMWIFVFVINIIVLFQIISYDLLRRLASFGPFDDQHIMDYFILLFAGSAGFIIFGHVGYRSFLGFFHSTVVLKKKTFFERIALIYVSIELLFYAVSSQLFAVRIIDVFTSQTHVFLFNHWIDIKIWIYDSIFVDLVRKFLSAFEFYWGVNFVPFLAIYLFFPALFYSYEPVKSRYNSNSSYVDIVP